MKHSRSDIVIDLQYSLANAPVSRQQGFPGLLSTIITEHSVPGAFQQGLLDGVKCVQLKKRETAFLVRRNYAVLRPRQPISSRLFNDSNACFRVDAFVASLRRFPQKLPKECVSSAEKQVHSPQVMKSPRRVESACDSEGIYATASLSLLQSGSAT